MSERLRKINFVSNTLIMALVIASVFAMFFGKGGTLSATRWQSFKYFTVDSNVLVGISSAISMYYLWKKDRDYSLWLMLFKLASTVSVAITFVTVMGYLGPLMGYDKVFLDANLYMHLIVPLLAMFSFVLFEPKINLKFWGNLIAIVPVTIYGVFYQINVAVNNDYGNIEGADWYGFGSYGPLIGLLMLLITILMGFGLSVLLTYLYKKIIIKMHKKMED